MHLNTAKKYKVFMRGFTLVEILIAIMISSVMMMGIFSAKYALQTMNNTMNNSSSLFLHTQAIASAIKKAVANVSGAPNDIGICMQNDETDQNFLCFRDASMSTNYPKSSLPGGPMPIWTCFTRLSDSTTARVNMHMCQFNVTDDTALTGTDPTACTNIGTGKQELRACSATDPILGQVAYNMFTAYGGYPTFTAVNGFLRKFSMQVISRQDPRTDTTSANPDVIFDIAIVPDGQGL